MRYKLWECPKEVDSPLEHILLTRGVQDIEKWKNANWEDINDPILFGKKQIEEALNILHNIIHEEQWVSIIVDSDCDGFTSAAIIINFLIKQNENLKDRIEWILHSGKQHGLEDTIEKISPFTNVVIIPDAGTNDIKEMQKLLDNGVDVLCMDHHESELWNQDAIIINNQISDYPNKNLSGAGVTWQVCRKYDEVFGTDYAKDLIDLAALGCCGDMMDYRSLETKAIISIGFDNIKNPFFYYMTEKNSFSINKKGGINYTSIAWYVVPFVNAMVRSGTAEEKELIFQSMLQHKAFEKIESGKRGHKGELVPRVEEAVRICTNVKARQTKLQDAAMTLLEKRIREQSLLKNAIIVLACEPGEVEKNLAGLVANKIQAKYQHPTLVLTRSKTAADTEDYFRGSARNYSMSEIQDFRQHCVDTGLLEYGQGHEGAFGFSIAASKLDDFINVTNEMYKDIPQEPVYWVDYIWNATEDVSQDIISIAQGQKYFGQDIPEPYICFKDVDLENCSITLMSKDKNPTLKISLPNGVNIIKFKSSEEEFEEFLQPNMVVDIVGTCNANEWNGTVSAQILCEDYDLREEWIF